MKKPLLEKHTPGLLDCLRQTTDFLETIEADRALLNRMPAEDRERLHRVVAQLYNPDPVARRNRQKAAERARSAAQTEREEAILHETGIRVLRRKPIFTTPNVFPPAGFEQSDSSAEDSIEPQHCYVCKQKFTAIHHFYDQMCPACAEFNFFKRTETAELTGRVALLTGGRVKSAIRRAASCCGRAQA